MTPRLARALLKLKQRGYATADDDFVFVSDPFGPMQRKREGGD